MRTGSHNKTITKARATTFARSKRKDLSMAQRSDTNVTESQELTLEGLMAVPGMGAPMMGALSIPERVQLRRLSKTLLRAVDDSLHCLTALYGEDIAGEGCKPGTASISWLMARCPNLTTLSLAPRSDHEEPWAQRERWALSWRWESLPSCSLPESVSPPPGTTGVIATSYSCLALEAARRYPRLTYLNLAGWRGVSDAGLRALAESCPNLTALDVSGCPVYGSGILAVARSCPRLRRLGMTACKSYDLDSTLVEIARRCPQLEALDVDYSEVTDEGVAALAHGCPLLRRLVLPKRVTSSSIKEVAQHCPLLEHLGIHSISDAMLESLAAHCPRLQRLEGRECERVTDAGISALAAKCTGLHRLNVPGADVSDVGMTAVASHCTGLEHLNVAGCGRVTDASISLVARSCRQLRHLSIAGCSQVTGASITLVVESCPLLRELLIGRTRLDDDVLKAIADNCPELRWLDVAGCRSDGGGLSLLASGCKKLEILDVSGSYLMTRWGLSDIAEHCTRLRVFRAAGIHYADGVISGLIEARGQQLRALDLSRSQVTDDTAALVAKRCPRLQELRVGLYVPSSYTATDPGRLPRLRSCRCLTVRDGRLRSSYAPPPTSSALKFDLRCLWSRPAPRTGGSNSVAALTQSVLLRRSATGFCWLMPRPDP
eukprot:jgi/Mesvir1/4771/Mv22187-RA.1